jgi:hypothetical protein
MRHGFEIGDSLIYRGLRFFFLTFFLSAFCKGSFGSIDISGDEDSCIDATATQDVQQLQLDVVFRVDTYVFFFLFCFFILVHFFT